MTKNNYIENAKAKGKSPFKTGVDYFESFNSKLQNRIEGFEEIKTIAPLLSSIPKYNPFELPPGYFDELPTIIRQRCAEDRTSIPLVQWLKLIFKPGFAIPVLTIVLIAVAGINFIDKSATPFKQDVAEELTLEEQLYAIDEATIIESLTADAGIEEQTTDDNNIEDYLIENNIDENKLNNEL